MKNAKEMGELIDEIFDSYGYDEAVIDIQPGGYTDYEYTIDYIIHAGSDEAYVESLRYIVDEIMDSGKTPLDYYRYIKAQNEAKKIANALK